MKGNEMRSYVRAAMVTALLVAATACAASSTEVSGSYVSVGSHRSTMIIARKQDLVRIELKGGGNPKDLASMAGDCEAVAEGQLSGGVIRAKLVPFEGEVTSLDAKDIEQIDPVVLVSFEKGIATVQGSFAHCGLRNALNGRYKKR